VQKRGGILGFSGMQSPGGWFLLAHNFCWRLARRLNAVRAAESRALSCSGCLVAEFDLNPSQCLGNDVKTLFIDVRTGHQVMLIFYTRLLWS
jgi:hypothetical protein